jgi:hypothetical protein
MRFNRGLDSNEIDESELNREKTIQEVQHSQESQLIEVMITKMHWIQFALIVNWIQMKSM